MLAIAKGRVASFAELGDLRRTFGVHWNWRWWGRRFEAEKGLVKLIEGLEFLVEDARAGSCGHGFRSRVEMYWEEGEGLCIVHRGVRRAVRDQFEMKEYCVMS